MSTNYINSSMEKYLPLRIMHNDEQQIQELIQQHHKQEQDRSFYRKKCMKVKICKAKLTVTLKNGEIKKIETKGPGIG